MARYSFGKSGMNIISSKVFATLPMLALAVAGCDQVTGTDSLGASQTSSAPVVIEMTDVLLGEPMTQLPTTRGAFSSDQPVYEDIGLADGREVWGSWQGSDENTGQGIWAIPAGTDTLVLKYISGFNTENQALTVRTQSGETLATFAEPRTDWTTLRIKINETSAPLELVVSDEGEELGAWIAITQPASPASE